MLVSEWLVSSGFLLLWSGFVGHAPVPDLASGGLHHGFSMFRQSTSDFCILFLAAVLLAGWVITCLMCLSAGGCGLVLLAVLVFCLFL
jgi:hypothetical protein